MSADYALSDADLLARVRLEGLSASGPGGQHANKTASGVRLIHPSGITAECRNHRERDRNRRDALHVLRIRLAATQRGGSDQTWIVEQARGGKLALKSEAPSYPRIAALLLDRLEVQAGSLAQAAGSLGLSTTQFTKALLQDPDIRRSADAIRTKHGLSPLRT
jgi:hypothetical protein